MRSLLVVLAFVAACSKSAPVPAPAAAPALQLVAIQAGDLPPGVSPRGKLEHAWKYVDKNGTHYVLFSSKRWGADATVQHDRNAELYADDWLVPAAGGAPKVLLPVQELVEDCPLELTARFHDDALEVTDLDRDGVGELTFAYEVGCRSDVRPNKYKVITLVNGTMYILRGTTRIQGGEPDAGTFVADPIFAKGPPRYLDHAEAVWKATADDADMAPTH